MTLPEQPIVSQTSDILLGFATASREDKGLIIEAVVGLLKNKSQDLTILERILWWNSPSEGVSTCAWKNWKMVFEIGQAIYITVGKHTLKFSFGKLYRQIYLVAVE